VLRCLPVARGTGNVPYVHSYIYHVPVPVVYIFRVPVYVAPGRGHGLDLPWNLLLNRGKGYEGCRNEMPEQRLRMAIKLDSLLPVPVESRFGDVFPGAGHHK
jgi:hypothetical protein